MRRLFVYALLPLLAACTTLPHPPPPPPPPELGHAQAGETVEVQILALNDFHGNLEPPNLSYEGMKGKVPVGGAAYLATALKQSRTANSVTVAAGDLISASPLISSLFYDEPTIRFLGDSGLALAAVGNHEFDRGPDELLRMQRGGCREKKPGETRVSCSIEPFRGAGFQYLAANVVTTAGTTLLPATAIRDVGGVRIGFIGMTLKETGSLVSPDGVKGLRFTDEATTANSLVPYLRQNGARAIVLLIHQGGTIDGLYDAGGCPGLGGGIVPILEKLDPAISLVVSGHTHNAYICRLPIVGGGERLLTSAGKFGGMITDIRLTFGREGDLGKARADFIPVQGEPIANAEVNIPINPAYPSFAADPAAASLVERYRAASKETASRPVGRLSATVAWADTGNVSPVAQLIADAQYSAAKDPARGGSNLSFMNAGGARTELAAAADGGVTYSQLFAMQPFANNIVTLTLSGADLAALMEQQFDSGLNTVKRPNFLMPSANVRFTVDRSRPAGKRLVSMTIDGKRLDRARRYRVTVNNFLASGGDGFSVLTRGTGAVDAGLDLEATEAYLKTGPSPPALDRITDLTPKGWVAPK